MHLPHITPGPWAAKEHSSKYSITISAPNTDPANAPVAEVPLGWPNPEANAQAIAAVPQILEVLNKTLGNLEDFLDPGGEFQWSPKGGRAICKDIRAALLAAGCTEE